MTHSWTTSPIAFRIDELMAEAGVDLGRPDRRQDRASRCCNEGMNVEDMEELVAWGHQTRRKLHTVGHWLGWATSSATRWRAVLADIRKLKDARARRHPTPNLSPVSRPAVAPAAAAERNVAMAFCRVRGDKAPVDVVAAEFGVTCEQVEAWVAEEERRRGIEPAKPKRRTAAKPPVAAQDDDTW